jgi:hypothetical protein
MEGKFLVWNGNDMTGMPLGDGAAYGPKPNQWVAVAMAASPSKRSAPAGLTGWSAYSSAPPGQAIVLGGFDAMAMMAKTDVGLYAPAANTWAMPMPMGWPAPPSMMMPPPPPSTHEWGVAVWTGQEMVLWSGYGAGTTLTQDGERFMP